MNWKKVKLGEICYNVTSGKTPPTSNTEYFNGEIIWINPSDFKEKELLISNRTISKKAIDEKKATLFPANSILISCIGDIGKIGILRKAGSCNQQITAINLNEKIDADFFYYQLLSKKDSLNKLGNNSVVPILNSSNLKKLDVSYPEDLATQKHIAEVLDKADALRQQNRQLLANYDELLQSTFIELFGDPSKFEKVSGKKVVTLIGGGAFKSTDYVESGIPLIRIGAINKGYFDENSLVFLPNSFEEKYKGFLLKNGDLLMTLTGTVGKDDYGNVFILESKYENYFLNQRVAKIICNKTIVNEKYLLYYFKQEGVKMEITGISRGVRQANISNSDIYSHKFLIPPLPLQQHFAKIVEQIEAQKAQAQAALTESEALFEGLLVGYFNA